MRKSIYILIHFLYLVSASLLLPSGVFCQEKKEIDSLIQQLTDAKTDSVKVDVNIALSRIYMVSELSRSLEYAETAVEVAEKMENSKVLSKSLMNIGNVYFNQGFFELALRQYNRYYEIQKQENNIKGIASALINLGAISLNLEDFEKAKSNCREAIRTFELLQQKSGKEKYVYEIVTSYNNLGIACQNLKEHAAAEEYYKKGVGMVVKTQGPSTLLANLYNNLASLYLDQKRLDEAYTAITEALQIRIEIADKNGQSQSYRTLAIYYQEKGDTAKAKDYLYKSIDLAVAVGNNSMQSSIASRLFDIYKAAGNSDSALKYHILLKDLNDKMNNEDIQREITRIELTAQFNERENLRKTEQNRKEQRYLLAGISMFLLLAITSLLYMLSQNRLKRLKLEKDNINLLSKNLQLEKASLKQELELRNKELTTNVMYQIQKNELVEEIIGKLLEHNKKTQSADTSIIYTIIKELEKTQEKTAWNEFELRFNQVHNEFYEKLNRVYPDLSTNERRLCAFLRLNMTTKEIASITGQSIRSIEVARTRLRRKLDLTNSESGLIEFLSSI